MDTIEKLIILTKNGKIKWSKYCEESYSTKIENIFVRVFRRNEENYWSYTHMIMVEAPYNKPYELTDIHHLDELYDTILKVKNITSFSVLDETLNKMMEKN